MKTKTLLLFVVFSFVVTLFGCSSNVKPPYQKPVLKNGDRVLARAYKTDFRAAIVCATKTEGISKNRGEACFRVTSGMAADDIAKLKEDQVIVAGCLGQSGMAGGGVVDTDELIPIKDSDFPDVGREVGKSRPPVEPNDIVIVQGIETRGDSSCPTGDDIMYPAVKVVKVEGGEVYFSFLTKDSEEIYTKPNGPIYARVNYINKVVGQNGVYKSKNWLVPSPKLTEILKKP